MPGLHAVKGHMSPFDGTGGSPMEIFRQWLASAEKSEPNDPSAAALATATPDGVPSVRMVLTKGADDRGPRFFTNRESRKGVELLENPRASLCFHWKSLRQQVRFEGQVRELDREETEQYFHSRSRRSQIAAAISDQSHPLASREVMDAQVAAYNASLGDKPVPLPEKWTGFVLHPDAVEFWKDGQDRLHDRIRFARDGESWTSERLYP